MVTEALRRFRSEGRILVGYDPAGHETRLLAAILAGRDPYELSLQLTAAAQQEGYYRPGPAELPCEYIDLAMRLSVRGQSPSLTSVAANLGEAIIAESPFPPGTVLTDEQWEGARAFIQVRLWQVWAVLEHLLPEIQVVETLAPEVGRDLRSVPNSRVVEYLFVEHFRQKTGSRPAPLPPAQEFTYQPVAGVRRPRTPEAAAWFDEITSQPIKVEGGSPKAPHREFQIGRTRLSVGGGGIHSMGSPQLYLSTRNHQLLSIDAVSFYPTLIARKGITPRAYGQHGQQIFAEILDRRLLLKQRIRQAASEGEREYLQRQSDALKLVLNSSFGNLGNRFSSLYDPAAMTTITLSGQLMLIDLIERLSATGARILLANTDGIFLSVDAQDQSWRLAAEGWQADTGMTLDIVPVQRLAVRNANNYAVKVHRGKYKRVGVFRGSVDPQHVPNLLINNDAVAMALLEDVPPEDTICRRGTPMVRFCGLIRQTAATGRPVLKEGSKETPLPTVVRWYRSDENKNRILWKGATRRLGEVENITLADDLSSKNPDPAAEEYVGGVDTRWYIKRARAELQKVRIPRGLARRIAGRSPLAAAVASWGLYPVPKWNGKNQPPGADAKRPSPHWNWDDYETAGVYTGAQPAILVVDDDEPAKFAAWAFGGNSPQLVGRHKDLENCLVVVRGEHTAEQVRKGQAPGKLIFRCKLDKNHPLNRIPVGYWRESRGVDIFYGNGMPSVLGEYSDPKEPPYRIEGERLTDAPEWLVRGLTPRNPGSRGHTTVVAGPRAARVTDDPSTALAGPEVEGALDVSEELEGLPAVLAELVPKLDPARVNWTRKESGDQTLLTGRCPFPHASGMSNESDLAAGYNKQGRPFVACKHSSCTGSKEADSRLKAWHRQQAAAVAPKRELVLTPIAQSMIDDLAANRVACHAAPPGAGKSYAIAQTAVARYRAGLCTCLSFPTIKLCEEAVEHLEEFAPDAFEAGAVARVFGFRSRVDESFVQQDSDIFGDYEVPAHTRILVCTHAQLGRRGFSRFLRGLWAFLTKQKPDEEKKKPGRPAFALIIDEVGDLVRHQYMEVPLAQRYSRRDDPDGEGGTLVYHKECVKRTRCGNCDNCHLEPIGLECVYKSGLAIRELRHPECVRIEKDGKRMRVFSNPLTPKIEEFDLGPEIRVGSTTFARQILGHRGRAVGAVNRKTAWIVLFKRDQRTRKHPRELTWNVFTHMLDLAYKPVMTVERPVDAITGAVVDTSKTGDSTVILPRGTCDVPRVRWTDLRLFSQASG